MPELDGKVAIVTGAGRLRGIGRAAAAAYARLGADVVVTGTGRNPDSFPDDEKAVNWRDVESTAGEIRALGRRALTMTVDVTNQEHVQAMIDGAVAEFGRVDILVNNAAFARGADRVPVADLTPDLFNLVMDIKVGGTFYCTKAFMEQITKQGEGGKIVNISSSAGKRGSSTTLAYNAAKSGTPAGRHWKGRTACSTPWTTTRPDPRPNAPRRPRPGTTRRQGSIRRHRRSPGPGRRPFPP